MSLTTKYRDQTSEREANEKRSTSKQMGSVPKEPSQNPSPSSTGKSWPVHPSVWRHSKVGTTRLRSSQLLLSTSHCNWYVFVGMYVCLSHFPLLMVCVCRYVCLSVTLPTANGMCLSVCMSVCHSSHCYWYVFVGVYVCLSLFQCYWHVFVGMYVCLSLFPMILVCVCRYVCLYVTLPTATGMCLSVCMSVCHSSQ